MLQNPTAVPATAQDDARWDTVVTRDARADGAFVYAVRTTRVYCRPGCPSRRPLRRNVAFYADPDAAEAEGFRACRRCDPRDEAPAGRQTAHAAVARARACLDADVDAATGARMSLTALAATVGVSPYHLQRTFKRVMGVSPTQYAAARRASRLKTELRRGGTVSQATFEAGYSGGSRAYAAADAHLGMTPAAYRRGGAGVTIRYATAATTFGRVLVAATARGVCAVTLGGDDGPLERDLAAEYPRATRERIPDDALAGHADLQEWVAAVVAHLAGAQLELDVPLDVAGTPLQHRVWDALRRVPYGETCSYAEVAAAVGAPRAVRAVASACARNRVALVVPCHRVVRSGGELGGYRWGVDRKRALLRHERGFAARHVGDDPRHGLDV